MMRSLFSGITGLRSHQTQMDVIGNNISNVNTVGYKKTRVSFADLYSQTISPASAPTGNAGGINAKQVGLGSSVSAIISSHTPGSAQYTGKPLDAAISGDGFYIVRTPEGDRFTRVGNFSLSSSGALVNATGNYLQCFESTYIQGNAPKIYFTGIDGKTTTNCSNFTFDSSTAAATSPSGNYTFEKSATSNTQFNVLRNGVPTGGHIDISGVTAGATPATVNIVSSSGAAAGVLSFNTSAGFPATDPDRQNELDGVLGHAVMNIDNNDGFKAGTKLGDKVIDPSQYYNVTLNDIGEVVGQLNVSTAAGAMGAGSPVYAKGDRVVLGHIALASFSNYDGLEKVGENLYAASQNSGKPMVVTPGSMGVGRLTPSSVEMSNVDLSEEMVNMITTQRGFQANSRIITTTDSMLEELVNLKR